MTNWTITSVACLSEFQGRDDVVYGVEWRAESGQNQATGRQGITFDPGNDHIPRSEITEEMLISWCKRDMGDKLVAEIEARLNQ